MPIVSKPHVSVFIATSLDGYIAREDGDIQWLHDIEPPSPDEDYGYHKFMDSVDCLVMGRNSFQKVLEFDEWPYSSKQVIVLSNSLQEVPKHLVGKVSISNLAPDQLLDKLASQAIKRIYLDGGQVIQSFLQAGLVDDMIVTRLPLLIGQGIPLFGQLNKDIKLAHVNTKSWNNGFVQSCYRIAHQTDKV